MKETMKDCADTLAFVFFLCVCIASGLMAFWWLCTASYGACLVASLVCFMSSRAVAAINNCI